MKTILHLSDLHLKLNNGSGKEDYCKSLLDKLTTDIAKQENFSIDTVFITGDICFSGTTDEFSIAKFQFIEPLLERLNLSYEDLYIVPGNHDVDRSKISIPERSLRQTIDSATLDDLYNAIEDMSESWPRLNSYRCFAKEINNHQSNILADSPLMTVREIGNNLIAHCLNSAWIAGDDSDYGNLRFLHVLKKSLSTYGKGKNNIVLMHHPIDWFHEEEQNIIAREFEQHVEAVFFGHMHQFEQSTTINLDQDITLKLQAGTLDPRSKNAGYSIINLHNPNSFKYGNVIYRKYEEEDEIYVPWEERVKSGISDFSLDKRSIFDSAKFGKLSLSLYEDIQYSHIANTGKVKSEKERLSTIFIEPNLAFENSIDSPEFEIIKLKNTNDIINHDGLSIISGLEQDGKTILLRKIQLDYLKKQSICNLQKIVFYINLENRYNSNSKILNALLSPYTAHDLHTSFEGKVKSSIAEGNAVFLIDNYHKSDKHTRKCIDDFIKSNAKNKFVITCERSISGELALKFSEEFNRKLAATSLGTILRKDIRKLISLRPNLYSNFSEDEVFNNLIKTIDNSQLPHNHFVYSILLSIYEQKNNLVGILNESDIIENYIEILLHKHCMIESKSRPSYKIIIHFLGFICSKMLFNRKLFFTEKEYAAYVSEFENLTFYEYPLQSYVSPVLQSEILVKNGEESYEFSNSCFYHFFLAYYLSTDNNTKDYVFDNDNYLHLDKTVEYYASRNSSSSDVLKFLENKVITIKNKLTKHLKDELDIEIDSLDIEELSQISFLDFASSNKEIQQKITEMKADREERDAELDKNAPLINEKDKATNVQRIDETYDTGFDSESTLGLTERYRKELSLFSKVFRSTELLMDPNEVMGIFDTIVHSYSYLTKAEMISLDDRIVLPLLVPKIEEKFTNSNFSEEDRSKIVEFSRIIVSIARAIIPNSVQSSMSYDLSTNKSRFQNIISKKLSDRLTDNETMLLRFLLVDIKKNELKEQINELFKLRGKLYSNALFMKILMLKYERHDMNRTDTEYLNSILEKLLKQNRSLEIGAIKHLQKVYDANN